MEWGETYFLKLIMVDLMMSKAFRRSFSLIVKGGAKRIISPCVGLASTPFSANLTQTSQASYFSAMTMAFKSPLPRTSFTTSVSKVLNSFLKKKKKKVFTSLQGESYNCMGKENMYELLQFYILVLSLKRFISRMTFK